MQLCVFGPFPKVAHPLHEKSAKDGALCKRDKKRTGNPKISGHFLVEVTGFEPATFWSRNMFFYVWYVQEMQGYSWLFFVKNRQGRTESVAI